MFRFSSELEAGKFLKYLKVPIKYMLLPGLLLYTAVTLATTYWHQIPIGNLYWMLLRSGLGYGLFFFVMGMYMAPLTQRFSRCHSSIFIYCFHGQLVVCFLLLCPEQLDKLAASLSIDIFILRSILVLSITLVVNTLVIFTGSGFFPSQLPSLFRRQSPSRR